MESGGPFASVASGAIPGSAPSLGFRTPARRPSEQPQQLQLFNFPSNVTESAGQKAKAHVLGRKESGQSNSIMTNHGRAAVGMGRLSFAVT